MTAGAPAGDEMKARGHEPELIEARRPADLAAVRELFTEYAEFMDYELCFSGFRRELERLPGEYAPPRGMLCLACVDGCPAGCVAVRRRGDGHAELCRLFVRPGFRGTGLGRALATRAIEWASRAGYSYIDLETVPARMAVAEALYRRLGFVPATCPEGTDPAIACFSCPLPGR